MNRNENTTEFDAIVVGTGISGVVNWTPKAAGTYYYQCSVHNGMCGAITVQ